MADNTQSRLGSLRLCFSLFSRGTFECWKSHALTKKILSGPLNLFIKLREPADDNAIGHFNVPGSKAGEVTWVYPPMDLYLGGIETEAMRHQKQVNWVRSLPRLNMRQLLASGAVIRG